MYGYVLADVVPQGPALDTAKGAMAVALPMLHSPPLQPCTHAAIKGTVASIRHILQHSACST